MALAGQRSVGWGLASLHPHPLLFLNPPLGMKDGQGEDFFGEMLMDGFFQEVYSERNLYQST